MIDYAEAIAYLHNTINFNDLEFGSLRQLSEVIKFLEEKQRIERERVENEG